MATIPQALAMALHHHRSGRLAEAAGIYQEILKSSPSHSDALHLLGLVLHQTGDHEAAIEHISRAILLCPHNVVFHNNIGEAYRELGRFEEAVRHYEQAIRNKADYAEAFSNRALALYELNRLAEAQRSCEQAIALNPGIAAAYNNLGNIFKFRGELQTAAENYGRALRLDPNFADAHNNLGNVLKQQGEFVAALTHYDRAIEIKPTFADVHMNRSFLLLLQGDFTDGWPEYEWRLKIKGAKRPDFNCPRWDGSPLQGQRILLYAEQGLGDTIQFVRYAPLIAKSGGHVILYSQPSLVPLLTGCAGIHQLVTKGSPIPQIDVYAPLLSLPSILNAPMDSIPADIPYLFANPALVQQWQTKLAQYGSLRVGIGWQGSPAFRGDRYRSIPFVEFAPLARIPGVQLFSLQKHDGVEQIAEARNRFSVVDLGSELDETAGPFMDTAAVMMNLDLVICSDTATAHLAGALGVPVWTALAHVPEWRWQLGRDDSPWYPTMRLYRQETPGDWRGVFERISKAVQELLEARRKTAPN